MAIFDHIHGTYTAGVAPEIIQYFDRNLQHEAENELVHLRDMEKVNVPKNSGKVINMRKIHAFAPAPDPLKEGVTPEGQDVIMSDMVLTVKPYGRHVEFTDELNLYAIDNTTAEFADLLSRQAAETLDVVGAHAKTSGKNVIYADTQGGVNTSRASITTGDNITVAHIKRAVRTLEKNKAKRFEDGYYHAIIDPETKYDLTSDPLWVDIATYQDKTKVEKYEIGKMMGVKFYETTLTRVYKGDPYLYDTVASVALSGGAYDVTTQKGYVTVAATTISATSVVADIDYFCRRMSQRVAIVDGCRALLGKAVYDGSTVKIPLVYMDTASNYTYAAGDVITPEGAGANGAEVHATIIYGRGFCGTVNLGSDGAKIQSIVNAPGSSGALDPLAQRGTVAWKVPAFGAAVMEDAYGVRVEHAVSV